MVPEEQTGSWGLEWDAVADVVVVGSGAAAFAAATIAASQGMAVTMLERADQFGGTTGRSGGGFWVPNNPVMRAAGIEDPRHDVLRYLARLAFPTMFDPSSATLGLDPFDFELLETFYDRGAEAIDA